MFQTEDVDTSANGSLLSTSQREDVDALLYAPKTLSREQEQRLKSEQFLWEILIDFEILFYISLFLIVLFASCTYDDVQTL